MLDRFVLVLFAVVLLNGSVFSSPPRHPGICTENDDPGYTFLTKDEIWKSPIVAKNGSEYQRFVLEVPSVSFSYKGKTYDIGGSSVKVVAKWESLPDGAAASYHRDYLKEGYQLKLDNACRDWLIKRLIGDDCEVRNNVLHEVTHYLVDLKYNGDAESPEYRFVQEMMAHMNGGNMTEVQAAKRIAERYPKLKILANEFLESNFVGEEAEKVNSSSKQKAKDMLLGVKKNPIEEKVCHADSVSVNELKATDVAEANSGDLTGEVGVRGWCDCGANHGKICFMGEGAYSSDGTNIGGGDYIYKLCGKCAKLFKPSRSRDEAEIIDLRIERKYKKFVGTERMPTHRYLSLLKQAENKLLDIPDGEIVIHGVCTCKEPDPIVFSYASYAYVKAGKQNLAVCCSCGKEYVSADGSVPCGPTAKREMGLE